MHQETMTFTRKRKVSTPCITGSWRGGKGIWKTMRA